MVSQSLLDRLPSMVDGVMSNDASQQLQATAQFRKILCIERNPPIEEVIKSGVVSRFVEFLDRDDSPRLQAEAAWSLTNIASGTSDNAKVVIDHGAVPKLIKLLSSPSADVRAQVVWGLANVAGDSPKNRDLVLGYGALTPILALFDDQPKESMLQTATWTLSNFCRGMPRPEFEQVKPALPVLGRIIHTNDQAVLADACWALFYLSDCMINDKIQAVIEAGVCPRLVELLLHPSPTVQIPALRTVCNITTGDDVQAQVIIDNKALPNLLNVLTQKNKKSVFKKEACRIISNITARNSDQIQAVIETGIIAPLVDLLQNAELDIKKEAAWAIINATYCGTHEQIVFLVREGCIKPLCDLLVCDDPRLVSVCLKGLEKILKVGEAEKNYFARMIDYAEGLEKIKSLHNHDNNEINEEARNILQTYWLDSLLDGMSSLRI